MIGILCAIIGASRNYGLCTYLNSRAKRPIMCGSRTLPDYTYFLDAATVIIGSLLINYKLLDTFINPLHYKGNSLWMVLYVHS